MSPDPSAPPAFPPALQARLNAAGVTDDASLQAALENDPSLRADFAAFFQQNPELLAAMQMNALLQAFAAVRDSEQMLAFWREVPTELEEPFMQAVEQVIAQAQAAGDADTVNHLTPRLEGFRQICAEAAQEAEQTPPTVLALGAFFQAVDDAAAAAVFEAQRALLQPYEAQQMMDALAAQPPDDADAATRQRIVARRDLLQRLRGAAPAPLADAHGSDDAPLAPRPALLHGDLYQAQEQHFQSAIADRGGVATVVNNIFVQSIERRWSRPTPPELRRDAVARPHEMAQIKAALAARGGVAITGEAIAPTPAIHRTPSLAVQGMAGVGKTVLAYLLAQELDAAYADGVIWEPLGPDFTTPAQTQAVLRTWAGYATNFFALDDNAQRAFTFEPAAVRTLLAEHPHLLVVLDNVWSLDAIKPLQAALPPGVHLVITTRSAEIARGLGAGRVEIGRLSDDEAAALVALRLRWQPRRDAPADAWVFALIAGIGGHALGLDVALGVLQREGGADRGEWQAAAQRLLAAIRRGDLGDLTLGDALDHNVQAVLLYSVRTLDAEMQRRFRRSGALAPDAIFTTDDMAAVWGCDADSARRTLVGFANAALVERAAEGSGRWRQHALLRGLALALLRAAGEEEAAAHAHARAYAEAMRAADDAQRYHELLPAMPQLRHAMTWAQANDLELALDIGASSVNLCTEFGLVREASAWSEAILASTQSLSAVVNLGKAYVLHGIILVKLADLPGEDRHQCLCDALMSVDEALRLRPQDKVPILYAYTQNIRGIILAHLATVSGEDRCQRLYDARTAFDESLRFLRLEDEPLGYASAQMNLGNLLRRLAGLPGEDSRNCLRAALAAYDEALRSQRSENAPLGYAGLQNNRGETLRELAALPGEDRRRRMYEALAAFHDALRYRRPENAPFAYAGTQNNLAGLLCELAQLPGENQRDLLYTALATSEDALRYFRQEIVPLDYSNVQDNRGRILARLATIPGEDRRERLYASLAAYNDALHYRGCGDLPFDYACTQYNRAGTFRELATLSDENQRQRLCDALAAYDEALLHLQPDTFPSEYASTQHNRANLLLELALLDWEDRREQMYDALAAYDAVLQYIRPDNALFNYVSIQYNRAKIFLVLTMLPEENQQRRLYEALAAYNDVLRYLSQEDAPLDYATVLNNQANILSHLATLPGEERRERLRTALHYAVEAVTVLEKHQQAVYLDLGRMTVRSLRTTCGDDFATFWAELKVGDIPSWLTEEADTNQSFSVLPDTPANRRIDADVSNAASLKVVPVVNPKLQAAFMKFIQNNNPQVLTSQIEAFAQIESAIQMMDFWQALPIDMENPFMGAVEACIIQAQQAGDDETVKLLQSRLDGFREICAGAARATALGEPLLAQLQAYQAQLAAADAENPQVEPWRGVTQAGEALLALQAGSEHLLDWDAVRRQVASNYNTYGNALDNAGDQAAALAAFEHAVALQPDFAMWRRNQTGTLIELGRLDEAAAALALARNLEPDAPRLAQLDADLAAARGKEE
jgi:hypothetical protein